MPRPFGEWEPSVGFLVGGEGCGGRIKKLLEADGGGWGGAFIAADADEQIDLMGEELEIDGIEFERALEDAVHPEEGLGDGIGFPEEGLVECGLGEDFEGDFGEWAEATPATDEHFGEIEAGGIFDDLSAGGGEFTEAIDHFDSENEIADPAEAEAGGAGDAGRDHSADGGSTLG